MLLERLRSRTSAWSLRVYFAFLFALVVVGSVASAAYTDSEAAHDARRAAKSDLVFSATTAAKHLGDHIAQLKTIPAGLAANPQIAQVFTNPEACTLSFQGIGGPDSGHLDVIRPDGSIACSSRPMTAAASETGYQQSSWLGRALAEPQFIAPAVDNVSGRRVLISTSPIPGRKGIVAAFADLGSTVTTLSTLYGGGRRNVFLVTTAGDTRVISRSIDPERWSGKQLAAGRVNPRPGSEWRDLDGVERLYVREPVPNAPWNVYVGVDRSAVFAPVDELRTRQLLITAAGLILLLLALALVYRKVASPIRRLSAAVRTAPDENAPEPVIPSGPTEVRALAEDLNALAASVHAELAERRRAEASARTSEESYRLLFEDNPSPMYVYDLAQTRFIAVNDAALRLYGYTRDAFIGMPVEELIAPEEVPRFRSAVGDLKRGRYHGLSYSGLWQHRRRDGSELDVEITATDHLFDGSPARVVLALDVTERVEAERLLRVSEARYRDLFENASDLIATVDLKGNVTDVNEAFLRSTGYTRAELLGKRLEDLIPADSREALDQARTEKLAGRLDTVYEHELLARDGRRIQMEVASRLIFEDGKPVGTEAICRDISERKLLEEQLRQGQRLEAIGRLAGGVAHDFNNLLTVISGYAEQLLDDRDRASEPELEQIAVAAERATILTRQLLAFSRRQVLRPRVLQLNDVVAGLTPMLSRLIGEDVELVATLAPTLHPVLADPNQLEQVLVNLAVNARDAMPEGGLLTIHTANVMLDDEYVSQHAEAAVGPHIMLSVSDTGIGMDDETLSHIFEPFFTTKPLGIGTGLGLATVYGIVKQSGGSMWVYSEPGQGTTFKALFPRAESEATEEDARAPKPVAETGTETILLAEDEESLRRLTARILEQHGYDVISAETATEAVEIAERNGRKIHLLLTDMVMPELSGIALAERVCELVPEIRVLYMSGYADAVVTRNGALIEGSAFLEKPFGSSELAAKVRETLDAAA